MKATFLAWLAAILLFGTTLPATADINGQTGFTYQGWTSDADESGSQWHIPIQIDGQIDRFSWNLISGYASTSGDLDGDSRRSISGLLDTQVGAAYALPAWIGLDWLTGVDLNLPTGQTDRDVREVRIMIDPDLVDIVSPGQGFNVNPYIGAAHQWNRWIFGLGVGYAFQGQYDYSDQTHAYDPGDMLNLAAHIEYALSDPWKLNLDAQYVTIDMDQVEGEDLLKKGDAWLIGTTLSRSDDRWELSLSVLTILKGKAQLIDASGSPATETRDSQGDEWIVDLQGKYHWRPTTSFNAGVRYLTITENGYEETSAYYMGRRQKYSLSAGVVQQLTDALDLACSLGGFIMDDEPNWLHPHQERQYHGWSVTAAITRHF